MPRIFDNIERELLPSLKSSLANSHRADFCVGYFNLRGWRHLANEIEDWAGGSDNCCRLLVGMQQPPEQDIKSGFGLLGQDNEVDNAIVTRLHNKLAQDFAQQLTIGAPTVQDEQGLRKLAAQLRAGKLVVKLFLKHRLHAKLYLTYRKAADNPITGYLGSSNLTLAGLQQQGELNVDVLDHDACLKLSKWFNDRWNDRWCIDISAELAEIIENSWARTDLLPPYQIYIKMAYHLSQEARAGLSGYTIPRDLQGQLFEFQQAAVKIAAHHVNKRGGVVIGDVVGLGKTLMATTLARILQDQGLETLIICPKNLEPMWRDYVERYRLIARILPLTQVEKDLPDLRLYRVVLIDESHNLRNREGKRYRAIQEYISRNGSKVILLSATPYNKTFLDLSNQLRLFLDGSKDLGIRPEQYLREIGGEEAFTRLHQSRVRSLDAFDKSSFSDDWRELMRLYLVRRTRSFIQNNYAATDPDNGRKFLTFPDGRRSYFPQRLPKVARFSSDDADPSDQYARLFAPAVVDAINSLNLPRYGLANYVAPSPHQPPTRNEAVIISDLSRAGKRLMGFCRTNLFKRLESGGHTFLLSLERHVLRNFIFLHALNNSLPLPIGTQNSDLLDTRLTDEDSEALNAHTSRLFDEGDSGIEVDPVALDSRADYERRAAQIYNIYATQAKGRFKWLSPGLFIPQLAEDLREDAAALLKIMADCGAWQPYSDRKLQTLLELVNVRHRGQKVIIFTQFADTVNYLTDQLKSFGVASCEGVTGESADPTGLAWRFSPRSNGKSDTITPGQELRVLVATDVLSEGQNLQDGSIVVNYDLPWAIIRLIQRAGRVDRIGQMAETILCYTFLPAEGVENIIRLRARVRQRLQENAEVIGTDEAFFEDELTDQTIRDLFTEKSGILDGDNASEGEVDLASYAYQIWKNAITRDPKLQKSIPALSPVSFATKPNSTLPPGVLVYTRTAEGNDALAWLDPDGHTITESQLAILNAAACEPNTPALPRLPQHHDLVEKGIELIVKEEKTIGGGLGRPGSARRRTYERLSAYAQKVQGTLFDLPDLGKAVEEIHKYPLRQSAVDLLNMQLRNHIEDSQLAELVVALREDDKLCLIEDLNDTTPTEPQIICSLGLSAAG